MVGGTALLTDTACRNAKPREKPYKLFDQGGLFLYVAPSGLKSWRWKYRIGGKEKQLVFGRYPGMGLKDARRLRDEADEVRRAGRDPKHEQEAAKARVQIGQEATFEALARQWHDGMSARWRDRHAKGVMRTLEADAFPLIGPRPIGDLKAPDVLSVLRRIEDRGSGDQAHRMRQRIDAIFAMAIGMGLAETNPAAMVGKALKPVTFRRHPALRTIEEARELILAVEAAPAQPQVKLASRLLAVKAVRSEAVRYCEPNEREYAGTEKARWRIPAEHMKGRRAQREDDDFEFVVPLPPQADEIFDAASRLAGNAKLLFGSPHGINRPMSDSTLSALYRRLPEWAGRHRPHGWRSTFSTIMNEWALEHGRPGDREVIDLMLAHKPQGVEGIYNRAAYMPRRRELAAIWADMLLDGLPPASSLLEGRRC
ncbi:integrase arm-type DNA-binding domain-containing protein [Sphingomicrobium sp. XHP0235]|uniref:tyrosine-type recombinase/integrase n=1 Tax=Sphingomicrobium aquimarinum TaxID=3133971 RepID=UPI0031FE8E37